MFPDKNLEAAVREGLNRPEGPLTRADLKGLGELDAVNKDKEFTKSCHSLLSHPLWSVCVA